MGVRLRGVARNGLKTYHPVWDPSSAWNRPIGPPHDATVFDGITIMYRRLQHVGMVEKFPLLATTFQVGESSFE
jgi:hypothetical protein